MNQGHILFVGRQSMPIQHKPMRVRGGKAGKVRTDLAVLARAHEARHHENLEVGTIVNDGKLFKRFGEVPTKFGWETTQTLTPIRNTEKVLTFGIIQNRNVIEDSNRMLRKVLLFKCITFETVKKDLENFPQTKQNKIDTIVALLAATTDARRKGKLRDMLAFWRNTKPFVTYNVNTYVEVDKSNVLPEFADKKSMDRSVKLEMGIIQRIQVGSIKVKNAFMNNGQKRLFFDGKSCEPVNEFLMSIN